MLARWALFSTCIVLLASACGGSREPAQAPQLGRGAAGPRGAKAAAAPGPLLSHGFAEVSDVIGPYVGRDDGVALAAWAEAGASGRRLFSAPIDARGLPRAPVAIGSVQGELDLVLVRGFGAASAATAGQPRFALVTTRRQADTTALDVTALDADGKALWGPTTLAERRARVLWLGFVVTSGKPLLVWAEQPGGAAAGEPAALYSLPVAPAGSAATPQLVVTKACAWQVAALAQQAALASVAPSGNACSQGRVVLDLLGASGKVDKSVDLGGRAALDLDLVAAPDAFVLAWSDHQQVEPRAFTAVVDARGGVLSPAAAAVPGLGEQAVVGLVAGSGSGPRAFLVWEAPSQLPEGMRFFQVSALGPQGRVDGASARLLYGRPDGVPELVSFDGGVAALTLAPACSQDDDCDVGLPVPTFVALDAGLSVRASEPLMLDALGGRAADLGWGLTCTSSTCFSLAAPSTRPAQLYTVPLPLRQSHYRAAAEQLPEGAKPRIIAADVLVHSDAPLAQLAFGALPGRDFVGYVTDFDPTTPWQRLSKPASDGRFEPLRARVALRPYADTAERAPLAEEQAVSLRAHSLGGLSLASTGPTAKELLAAWTGLDKGEPQVFLTLLGADASRRQQRMLTRKQGEANDVAALALDDGYLIAWVDERSRDAEVYAARVGRSLEKASPEQRITSADGAAADLLLTRVGGKPYAVWADARTGAERGLADIYGAFLRPTDAGRDGAEHHLSSTRPHSFAPQVAQLGGTPVLAWLEEAADSAPAGVRLARLSDAGEIEGGVASVSVPAGAPRGLGLWCSTASCRAVVTVESEGRGELYGLSWKLGDEQARLVRLAGLGSPEAASASPIVQGDLAYVADVRDGQGLVRRLTLEW